MGTSVSALFMATLFTNTSGSISKMILNHQSTSCGSLPSIADFIDGEHDVVEVLEHGPLV